MADGGGRRAARRPDFDSEKGSGEGARAVVEWWGHRKSAGTAAAPAWSTSSSAPAPESHRWSASAFGGGDGRGGDGGSGGDGGGSGGGRLLLQRGIRIRRHGHCHRRRRRHRRLRRRATRRSVGAARLTSCARLCAPPCGELLRAPSSSRSEGGAAVPPARGYSRGGITEGPAVGTSWLPSLVGAGICCSRGLAWAACARQSAHVRCADVVHTHAAYK